MIYLIIFLGKIVEVSICTMRVVLISKGERKVGTLLAFFEISLWLVLASKVLGNITADPKMALAYAIGFTIGNYLGSMLEDAFGIGTAQVQIIASPTNGQKMCDAIYDLGYAYTMVEANGRVKDRTIIYTLLPRKAVKKVIEKLRHISEDALISVHETKPVRGGFGLKRK